MQVMPPAMHLSGNGSTEPIGLAHEARQLIADYRSVPLSSSDALPSTNRCDTKFLLSRRQLIDALAALQQHYSVLEVGGTRLQRYRTVYFDTAGFALYFKHHSGSRNRYKVRCRHYLETDRAFLEVKQKISASRSLKARLEAPAPLTELDGAARRFVEANTGLLPSSLQPKLWNNFERITLASRAGADRATLDLSVSFDDATGSIDLPGVVIAELKQPSIDRSSAFFRTMRAMGSRPTGFSKYCIGAQMLNPQLKGNRFRTRLRRVEELAEGGLHAG